MGQKRRSNLQDFSAKVESSALGYEPHYFDTVFGSGNLTHNALINYRPTAANQACDIIFAPVTGSDSNNRVGRVTQLIRIEVRGIMNAALQNGNFTVAKDYKPNLVRLIFFVDKNANAAKPTPSDVLMNPVDPHWKDPTGTPAITPNTYPIHAYCLLNMDYKKRFSILSDTVKMLGGTTCIANTFCKSEGRQSYMVRLSVDCDVETVFDDSVNGDQTDVISGGVYALALGMFNTDATANPTVTGQIRCTFMDV